ncbi:hypothetical protein K458DRAFT_489483 [Lentithecium fluviatile CBS 122367]|uniref:Fungal N-terminal domain-containing protein n=1 Tax=Lentithecium fluviatile CBS 122367 TaxID=1168545 RepID=A0A6G1IT97_9PLEO|nr:hypothetical protein K458DRAFT_489483 [Lentithecium fluviatile CBS 122367]
MAELVASALTIGEAAAQLSLALFKVARAVKNAPKEIAEIAGEISDLSASLMVLADILDRNRLFYKPALLEHVSSILHRFGDIREDLDKLTHSRGRGKLKRLKWFFDGPKAKGLLKKVDGIKASLNLVLNIIHLAREQTAIEQAPQHRESNFNRFRKPAESIVATNRLAIEKIQEEERDNPTEKRRHYDSELQRWKIDNHDTATWLYHAVFSTNNAPSINAKRAIPLEGPRSATVEDCNSDTSEPTRDATTKTAEGSTRNEELIIWNKATEPSIVVDRLLGAWTLLNHAQIQASRDFYASGRDSTEETWTDDLVRDLQEYEKRKLNGLKEIKDPTNPFLDSSDDSSEVESVSLPNAPGYSSDDEKYVSAEEESTLDGNGPSLPPIGPSISHQANKPNEYNLGRRYLPDESREKRRPKQRIPFNPNLSSHTRKRQSAAPFNAPYQPTPSYSNPFAPDAFPQYRPPEIAPHVPNMPPPFSAPTYHPAFAAPPVPPPAFQRKPPSPPPRQEPYIEDYVDDVVHSIEGESNEKKQEETRKTDSKSASSRLERLEALLAQELIHAQKTDHEEEYQKILSRSTKENEDKLDRLEKLLLDQQEDQLRRQAENEAAWKLEKIEREARYAKDAIEAKELAEKEISAAKAAKKAAEKALKFAKKQVEERVRKEAEDKAAAERRKTSEEYQKRMQTYDEQLTAFSRHWQGMGEAREGVSPSVPLRTTCFSEGGRRIEVSEFTKERLEPFLTNPVASTGFFNNRRADEQAMGLPSARRPFLEGNFRYNNNDSAENGALKSPFSYIATRASDVHPKSSQQVLLLPAHLERTSMTATSIQSRLEACGVSAVFDNNGSDSLVGSQSSLDQVVHSTIFWEPPALSLGSELLTTLRHKGWQPLYVRKSDAGHTYFLGHHAIHVHFFQPDYQPQLKATTTYSASESVSISKDLVDEYALEELGFPFTCTESGSYTLDSRLTASDIYALIDRSFMLRETQFRRAHRQLLWGPQDTVPASAHEEYEHSVSEAVTSSPTSVGGSEGDGASVLEDDYETPISSVANDRQIAQSGPRRGTLKPVEPKIERMEDDFAVATSTGARRGGLLRLRSSKAKSHED